MLFQGRTFVPRSLLRPRQVTDIQEDIQRCENNIAAARFNPSINASENMKRLRSLKTMLDQQAPVKLTGPELDAAVKRERELLGLIKEGMPTGAEMRRCPQGATDKHIRWEQKNKPLISEWKSLRLTLQASGVDFGTELDNVANYELYRPVGGSRELPMEKCVVETPNSVRATAFIQAPSVLVAKESGSPTGEVYTLVMLEPKFFGLKKQVKKLTGKTPKNKAEAVQFLDDAGIHYQE